MNEILGDGRFAFNSKYKIDIGQEEPIEVSKLKLYKFDREGGFGKETTTSRQEWIDLQLVLYQGAQTDNTTQDAAPPEPTTLEDAKREVAEALKEIWQLPESQRSSAIKRLIRRWHPDKNKHRESFANEVTKFLLNEVDRLKKGGVPGYQPDTDNSNQAPRRPPQPNGADFNFEDYFRRYRDRRRRRHEWRDADYEDEPHNAREAERWMKQAQKDFKTASYLFQSDEETFYSSTCFHCQQAIEKALKALMFAKGRLKMSDLQDHDVLTLAYRASEIDPRLRAFPEMVKIIQKERHYIRTRYPQYTRGKLSVEPIPAELFGRADAEKALSNAREILQLIQQAMD